MGGGIIYDEAGGNSSSGNAAAMKRRKSAPQSQGHGSLAQCNNGQCNNPREYLCSVNIAIIIMQEWNTERTHVQMVLFRIFGKYETEMN